MVQRSTSFSSVIALFRKRDRWLGGGSLNTRLQLGVVKTSSLTGGVCRPHRVAPAACRPSASVSSAVGDCGSPGASCVNSRSTGPSAVDDRALVGTLHAYGCHTVYDGESGEEILGHHFNCGMGDPLLGGDHLLADCAQGIIHPKVASQNVTSLTAERLKSILVLAANTDTDIIVISEAKHCDGCNWGKAICSAAGWLCAFSSPPPLA